MATYRNKRALPVVLVVIIVIVAVAALVSLARAVFFSGDSSSTEEVDTSRQSLLTISEGRSVSMTVRGPIVADEQFQSYQIDVSPSSRSLTTYSGYLDAVMDQTNLGNNTAAYEQFVFALDKANLPKGKELDEDKDDVRGICATGRLYEFNIVNDGQTVKRLWTSTCRGSKGSLNANVEQLRALFLSQIPDAAKLIRDLNL